MFENFYRFLMFLLSFLETFCTPTPGFSSGHKTLSFHGVFAGDQVGVVTQHCIWFHSNTAARARDLTSSLSVEISPDNATCSAIIL
jgi:hypothetical protein